MRHRSFRSRIASVSLVGVCVFGAAAFASAQTLNPTRAEFSPSPDHNAVVNGVSVVSSYTLEFYIPGATAPFRTASLGKPAPDPDGVIRIDLSTVFVGWPTPGTVYVADVAAVGPGGSAASTPSNTFSFSGACAPTLSPTTQSIASVGGTVTAAVAAATGCTWTAASNVSWMTITAGATGSGSGSVGYSVAANTGTTARTGTLTIGGQTLTVTQAAPCAYTVSPTSISLAAAGGSGSAAVTTAAGCAWTAASNVPAWMTVSTGAAGSGNGTVTFSASANTGTTARTGTLTVAGRTVTVTQAGACVFTLAPTAQTVLAAGGTSSATVTTTTGCAWTAVSRAAWITVASAASGTGTASVSYTVAANTATSVRSGTLTIGGQTLTVTQSAAAGAPPPPGNVRVLTN